MNDQTLHWSDFDWSAFQKLSIQVAENQFPGCSFDEYLKKGQKQEGVDLLSFNKSDGSRLAIQCKRIKALTESELQTIIDAFLTGKLAATCSAFIVSVSCDLQTPDMQAAIYKHKQELLKNHHIEFDCWDISIIEGRLRNMHGVVAYHFGRHEADMFCYPELKTTLFKNIVPVEDYIPRKTTPYGKEDPSPVNPFQLTREYIDLKDLFTKDRHITKQICLIGDAYQGKSSYLRQLAFNLQQQGERIQPLLIEIKKQPVQGLESILDTYYGAWQNIPLKELILVIDGLDEVPTDKFTEMVGYINQFAQKYRTINIALSCRKLFFNLYDIKSKLDDFSVYQLAPLDGENINTYLQDKLGQLFYAFKDEAYRSGIIGLLYHPFYLVNLVQQYLEPPHHLPGSKIKVLDNFIEQSFNRSLTRPLQGSNAIKQESYQFTEIIKRFAFALQLSGKNAFTETDVQVLFNEHERQLLQNNALVDVAGDNWSFANALFQEHLAASLLYRMPYEQIISHCTIGTTIRKIKTRWVQTICSLFSLLDMGEALFDQLLTLIKNDSIELIFQTEPTKYPDDLKTLFLKELIQHCIDLAIRPTLIPEETIGQFIDTATAAKDYLLECLEATSLSERIKIACATILANTLLSEAQQARYTRIAIDQVQHSADGIYAGKLVEVFTAHRIGDTTLIQLLITVDRLSEEHAYRNSIYELIISRQLTDTFYQYGLNGITAITSYNKSILHVGSERVLEDFLLSANSSRPYKLLLQAMTSDNWMNLQKTVAGFEREFLPRVLNKLAEIYNKDNSIILSLAWYINALGRRHHLDEHTAAFRKFLDKTQAHWILARLLLPDILIHNNWYLSALVDSSSFDFILFEWEDNQYTLEQLARLINGLRFNGTEATAREFYDCCMAATGGYFESKEDREQYTRNQEMEKQKRKNDLRYIASKDAFKKGVETYFAAFGKRAIPESDLYLDDDAPTIRRSSDSYFIFEFLAHWMGPGDRRLKSCLERLEQPGLFDYFRATEIMDYPYMDETAKATLLPILETYYTEQLPVANFPNCMWWEDGHSHWRQLEVLLSRIFQKYQFATEEKYLLELIWTDTGGINNFSATNRAASISELVVARLQSIDLHQLRRKVIDNLKTGIQYESVLASHIVLCRKLVISEATDFIFDYLSRASDDNNYRVDAATIYLELGGDVAKLAGLYKTMQQYNEYFFFHLTKALYKILPDVVIEVGLKALYSATATVETKVRIAQILIELGVAEAFKVLVDMVRHTKKAPHFTSSGHLISQIDTRVALQELNDVMYLVIDKTQHQPRAFHDNGASIILEWIYTLAAKSEADLGIVIQFLQEQRNKLAEQYPEAPDFNWYVNRCLENFRNSDKTTKTISQVKSILAIL